MFPAFQPFDDELSAGRQLVADTVWSKSITSNVDKRVIGAPSATVNGTGWTGVVNNGNASSGNWSVSANWDSNPPAGDERNLFFGQAYKNTGGTNFIANNDLSNYFGWHMTFENVANPVSFTLQGNAITLFDFNPGGVARIENDSTVNQNLNFAGLQFGGSLSFAEINAINGPLSFGSSATITFAGSVSGIKLFGSGQSITFNDTINGSGKWFALTGSTANTVNINGSATTGDWYVMNGGTLALNNGGSITTSAIRLGGDFGTTGNQDLSKGATFALTSATGGQSFSGTINTVAGNTSDALLIDSRNGSGTNTISSQIFLDSELQIQQAKGNLLFQGGGFDLKDRLLTVLGSGTVIINETLGSSFAHGGALIKTGFGTLILQGTSNTYSGTDPSSLSVGTLISSGTLGIYGDGSLGLVPLSANINIQLSGILQDAANDIALDAKRNILVSGNAQFDPNGHIFTINGLISGSGGVTVGRSSPLGTGTVRLLNSASTYAGGTQILSGTLEVTKLADAGSSSSIGNGTLIFLGFGGLSGSTPTLKYLGSGDTTNRELLFEEVGVAIDSSGTGPITFSNSNTVQTIADPVTLTLTGSNTDANTFRPSLKDDTPGVFISRVTKDGPGQWVLTGTSPYSGPTTVKNGTLAVQNGSGSVGRLTNTSAIIVQSGAVFNLAGDSSVSDRLNNNASVMLTNGTLRLSGVPEGSTAAPGLGALSLTSNTTAVFDLVGTSLLHIAASGSQIWTGTLSIWNWDGSLSGGALEQILFGTADNSTSLTQAQLNQVSFYSDAGLNFLGTARFAGLGNGEIVPAPIPEPATTSLVATFALVALGYKQRRRFCPAPRTRQ